MSEPVVKGLFPGPHGAHVIEMADPSVTVIFDGTGYRWTKYGPTIENARDRAVVRSLLHVAIEQLDAS